MEDEQNVAAPAISDPAPNPDDARVVMDFGAGPYGVGPVMGFDSDDFFRPLPRETLESDDTAG